MAAIIDVPFNGCCSCGKDSFMEDLPPLLNGRIRPDEYARTIGRINRVRRPLQNLVWGPLVAMLLFVVASVTLPLMIINIKGAGFAIGMSVFAVTMALFIAALVFVIVRSRTVVMELNNALAEENVKYASLGINFVYVQQGALGSPLKVYLFPQGMMPTASMSVPIMGNPSMTMPMYYTTQTPLMVAQPPQHAMSPLYTATPGGYSMQQPKLV